MTKGWAAYNGRFGAMAAVTPQTIFCGIERLSPAGTAVEAPPAPSRHHVVRHCERSEAIQKTRKNYIKLPIPKL